MLVLLEAEGCLSESVLLKERAEMEDWDTTLMLADDDRGAEGVGVVAAEVGSTLMAEGEGAKLVEIGKPGNAPGGAQKLPGSGWECAFWSIGEGQAYFAQVPVYISETKVLLTSFLLQSAYALTGRSTQYQRRSKIPPLLQEVAHCPVGSDTWDTFSSTTSNLKTLLFSRLGSSLSPHADLRQLSMYKTKKL